MSKLSNVIDEQPEENQPEETHEQLVRPPKWRSVGTTLNRDELAILDEIAEDYDVSRNSVIRYAINKLIKEYQAGTLAMETTPTRGRKLKMP